MSNCYIGQKKTCQNSVFIYNSHIRLVCTKLCVWALECDNSTFNLIIKTLRICFCEHLKIAFVCKQMTLSNVLLRTYKRFVRSYSGVCKQNLYKPLAVFVETPLMENICKQAWHRWHHHFQINCEKGQSFRIIFFSKKVSVRLEKSD